MGSQDLQLLHLQLKEDTDFDELELMLKESDCRATYDLLQQAIIVNNTNAVTYLLMKGVYPDFHHPICNSYLHLACKLGRVSMVKTIIECRPGDLTLKGRVCYPNECYHDDSEKQLSNKPTMSVIGQLAIDVTVTHKQTACLQAILNNLISRDQVSVGGRFSQSTALTPLAYICHIDHPKALELLLQAAFSSDELNNAYYEALIKKRDKCLEVLFRYGYNQYSIRGMNPYHILYQYSSGYNQHVHRHDRLCATTSILLSRKVDVTSKTPAGSYPLYSLLELILKDAFAYGEEYLCETVSRELLSCLKLILRQGVRLDIDEIHLSLGKSDPEEVVAFGRDLYTSVFDVISTNTGNALSVNLAASEMITELFDILLQYSDGIIIRPSHLTGLLQLLVRSYKSRSSSRNLQSVIYKLLWLGVNVSIPIQQPYGVGTSYMTLYLLNAYVQYLCDIEDSRHQHTLNDNPVLKWLSNSMSYNAICSANQINYRILSSARNNETLTSPLIRYVTRPPVLRLKTLSARVIWFSIGRKREKLNQLKLPNSTKTCFLDIITKEI